MRAEDVLRQRFVKTKITILTNQLLFICVISQIIVFYKKGLCSNVPTCRNYDYTISHLKFEVHGGQLTWCWFELHHLYFGCWIWILRPSWALR